MNLSEQCERYMLRSYSYGIITIETEKREISQNQHWSIKTALDDMVLRFCSYSPYICMYPHTSDKNRSTMMQWPLRFKKTVF